MNLDRMYRIVETGEVNDPAPVDNVLRMAEERQRQQQQARPQSAWGRFKNFAGSNAGRTLWGGLGTALGVGLTGGNLQDALGYGVIGAGNTVGTLNQNRQYANRLALKQQERADALAKEQRDRDFKTDMLNRQIEAQKEAANAAFERTLQQLAINNQYAKERANLAREWAVEDRDVGQAFTREGWENTARQNELGRSFQADQARLGREFQADQAAERRAFAVNQALQNRDWALADEARNNERYWERTQDSRDYAARQLQDQRNYNADQLALQRAYDEGLYDRRKEDERRYNADILADARNYDAGLRAEERNRQLEDEQRQFQNDLALLMAKQSIQNTGYQPGDVVNGYVMTGNKKYDDAYLGEIGKKKAQSQKSEEDYRAMVPTVIDALDRAWEAASDGTGTGPIGGRFAAAGLNPWKNAGANYADIQSANTQMNTILRKKLGATGLTGSELNSAIEAQAYRYQIDPTDNEPIIKRKIQNFARDHLGIDNYAGNGGGNSAQASKVPTDEDAWGDV